MALIIELLPRLCDTRLVGNGPHAHPSTQDTHLVDGVERLGTAADLHEREGASLGRPDRPVLEENPVDLVLEAYVVMES